MRRDLYDNIKQVVAINPERVTDSTDIDGQTVDLIGFESCTFLYSFGTLADTGSPEATFTPKIEESDNGTDWTAVADSDLLGSETAQSQTDADDSTLKIGYIGDQRYVRGGLTIANNNNNADVSAVAVLGDPLVAPVTS